MIGAFCLVGVLHAQYWNPKVSPTGPLDQNVEGADLDKCLVIEGPPLDTTSTQG